MATQRELDRRAKQSASAQVAIPAADERISDISAEEAEQAVAQIEAVNLDEMLVRTERIAFRDFVEDEITLPNGVTHTVRRPVLRYAEIGVDALGEAELQALDLYNRMRSGELSEVERLREMARCVLAVWKVSEPWMTLDALMEGLGTARVGKVFLLFFNPPSRP